jgi:hypothetical protein
MKQKQRNYHSYLLRLWCSGDENRAPWHIMLEKPHTGQRHSFAGFSDLFDFLSEVVTQQPVKTKEVKFMDHHMHHMPHDHGVHGMLLFGEETLYLSHLPMFMTMHDHQLILEVALAGGQEDAQAVYRADRRDTGERVYTLVPERFSLRQLGSEGADALRSFQATVHRGHFEKKGNKTILADVTVNVVNVVHFRKFDPNAEAFSELRYLLFGRGRELYLAHLIGKAPDFDQIAPVTFLSHGFSEETLRRGVCLAIPGRENRITHRLQGREKATAQVQVALETAAEIYLEEGELAEEVTFDPTAEEKAAGFP